MQITETLIAERKTAMALADRISELALELASHPTPDPKCSECGRLWDAYEAAGQQHAWTSIAVAQLTQNPRNNSTATTQAEQPQ